MRRLTAFDNFTCAGARPGLGLPGDTAETRTSPATARHLCHPTQGESWKAKDTREFDMTITMDAARLLTTSASSSVFILASSSPIGATP